MRKCHLALILKIFILIFIFHLVGSLVETKSGRGRSSPPQAKSDSNLLLQLGTHVSEVTFINSLPANCPNPSNCFLQIIEKLTRSILIRSDFAGLLRWRSLILCLPKTDQGIYGLFRLCPGCVSVSAQERQAEHSYGECYVRETWAQASVLLLNSCPMLLTIWDLTIWELTIWDQLPLG